MQTENKPKVAYFCMEYGLDDELHIYCGGLGILAGDYLKAAKDLNVPVVGLGILWRQDYTNQYVGDDGWPFDMYKTHDFDFLEDTGVEIKVAIEGNDVPIKVWKATQFENAPLYLLDAGYPDDPNGWMTSKLYGGGDKQRVASEIILGIGGVRALRALDIDVDLYHFNEGHAAFAGFELIREKMSMGVGFEEAFQEIRKEIVFTTHTPVLAGNEDHDISFLEQMGATNGLNRQQLERIAGDPFNMTVAGLRMASIANGVSELHTGTAKRMWDHVDDRAEIIDITNGVHQNTWQNPNMRETYENGGDIWATHYQCKERLMDYVKRKTGQNLNPDTLTIGFARRAAPYKRGELIFRNADAIDPLLKEGKLQLIFSGKAHPEDDPGKEIVRELVKMSQKYPESVVFLENYDMRIADHLVSGSDIWLNNPKRPLEASGTSGMKAALNGVLNLSVLDGWVGEGVEHGVSGWLIDEVFKSLPEKESEDERDLQALYHLLYEKIIPMYYDDKDAWVEMMQASMEMADWDFTAQRMVDDYYTRMYEPTVKANKKEPVTV